MLSGSILHRYQHQSDTRSRDGQPFWTQRVVFHRFLFIESHLFKENELIHRPLYK